MRLARGTDSNFYDEQKNVKAKIENKTFSSVQELDTIRAINCEVFCKHLTTITHRVDREKSKSSSKYIPSKYMP